MPPDASFGPIPKYEIVEPLKTGGTAAIYLAILRGENRFSREVVIKRPLPHLIADRRLRAMFIDEAHIASRLSHPNIVQVLDLVAREDEIYLVLEYLKGRDLREILKRCIELGRTLPIDVAVWVLAEMAAGMDYAHEAKDPDGKPLNLVHRDVSPKNVRVTDSGAVKLIDFGIARVERRITETAPGSVKGTLGYMSPEQVMGEDIDRRSDIFSAGICLFQMLTVRNPFDAENLQERIRRLVHEPLPKASEFNRGVDQRLDDIVARTLDRDVKTRYQTAKELQRDLEAYHASLSVASPRERLVNFLEEIFPDIHEIPKKLKEALTTISGSVEERSDELDSWATGEENTFISQKATARDPRAVSSSQLGAWSAWAGPPDVLPHGVRRERSDQAETEPMEAQGGSKPLTVPWQALVFVIVIAALAVLFVQRENTVNVTPLAEPPSGGPLSAQSADATAVEVVQVQDVADASVSSTREDRKRPRIKRTSTHAPRDLFRAGARLDSEGALDDAKLMYTLAYAESGDDVNPAIYRNLALLHERNNDVRKLRACFNMYLHTKPNAKDKARIQALLANSPQAPSASCVTSGEVKSAKKRARRIGARIEGWIEAAR